jgi:hypothetical protein
VISATFITSCSFWKLQYVLICCYCSDFASAKLELVPSLFVDMGTHEGHFNHLAERFSKFIVVHYRKISILAFFVNSIL